MIFGEDFGQLAASGEYEVYKSGTTISQLNDAIATLSDEEYLDSFLVANTRGFNNSFIHLPALSATRRYLAINGNSTTNIIYNQYWQNGVLTLLVKFITSGSLDVRIFSTDGTGDTLLTINSWTLYRRQKGYDVANGGSNVAYAIAPVQNTLSAANKSYAVGEQFLYDGHLYKVTSAITSGAQIVIGTNAEAAGSVTEQTNPEIITLTDYDSTTMHIEYQNCWKSGHVVHIMARIKQLKTISNNIIAAETLPKPKCTGNYFYGIGFVYRNSALRNIDTLNATIQKSTGYLCWNGGAGQVNDIIQIQVDYCTDE